MRNLYLTTASVFHLLAQSLTADHGDLNAAAGGSIGIANYAAPNGNVTLTAVEQTTSNITIGTATDGGGSSGGPVIVNVSNAYTVTNDTVVTSASTITINAASIMMEAGSGMTAGGMLSLTSSGDMTLGALASGLAPDSGTAIQLISGGGIFGNGDGQKNLSLTGVAPTCTVQPCTVPQIRGQPRRDRCDRRDRFGRTADHHVGPGARQSAARQCAARSMPASRYRLIPLPAPFSTRSRLRGPSMLRPRRET